MRFFGGISKSDEMRMNQLGLKLGQGTLLYNVTRCVLPDHAAEGTGFTLPSEAVLQPIVRSRRQR
jgi:hypothetical protein